MRLSRPGREKTFFLSWNSCRGMSLIEAMVSIVLMAMMVVLTLQSFHSGTRLWDSAYVHSKLTVEAQRALELMVKELRRSAASQINLISADTLRFKMPEAVDDAGNITWSGWYEYSLAGEQILRTVVATSDFVVVANEIAFLEFTQSGSPVTINIDIRAEQNTTYGHPIKVSLVGKAELRN